MNSQIVRAESLKLEPDRGLNGSVTIRNQYYCAQTIEHAIACSHPMLHMGDTAVFSLNVKKRDRLVIIHEIDVLPIEQLNTRVLVQEISCLIGREYGFQVYGVVFIKQGSLPRDAEGKKQRYLCRQKFVSGELAVVADWCEGPQYRQSFQLLKRDLETLLAQMISDKRDG
ncbi:MAG: hypothetical protein AB8B99_11290 [Phormidesmis sp.]